MDPVPAAFMPAQSSLAGYAITLALLLDTVRSIARIRDGSRRSTQRHKRNPRHVTADQLTAYATTLRQLNTTMLQPKDVAVALFKGIDLAESTVHQTQHAFRPSFGRRLSRLITRFFRRAKYKQSSQIHTNFVRASERLLADLRKMREAILALTESHEVPPEEPIILANGQINGHKSHKFMPPDVVLVAASTSTPGYGVAAMPSPILPLPNPSPAPGAESLASPVDPTTETGIV